MRTLFLSSRGSLLCDPEIEDSRLATLLKKTFDDLHPPGNISGEVRLCQFRDNPDRFDLYFYSNSDSKNYRVRGTYTAPDIAVFARSDFQDFPDLERDCSKDLHEFARRLTTGEL